MMNKTEIDWCDFTWNPVTGCRRNCPYCYARKMATRFQGDARLNLSNPQLRKTHGGLYELDAPFRSDEGTIIPFPAGFEPTFHRYRLKDIYRKKKPARIFVCSVADLFAPDIPAEWIAEVFDACRNAPWHKYLFLTKFPKRYKQLEADGALLAEDNFWFGTTVTLGQELDRLKDLPDANTFISIEPILSRVDLDLSDALHNVDWIIAGAETGNQRQKTKPEASWIAHIVAAAKKADIPLLLKHSDELAAVWPEDIQQFPASLAPEQDEPIPHCKSCPYAKSEHQGRRGDKYSCTIAPGLDEDMNAVIRTRHILGRYTRSSPPWCPLRKENRAGEEEHE